MLIENQLDDRHDLHGNTLYRLRFDATILPTERSESAAQIEITIQPEGLAPARGVAVDARKDEKKRRQAAGRARQGAVGQGHLR
jgi:hypothetical protein